MARLIQAPQVGASPRVLRIPRARADAAPTDGSAALPEAPALPSERDAALAAAEVRAAEAEARAKAAADALESLRAELENTREEARRSGHEAGRAEAAERAAADHRAELERLRDCVDALSRRVGERLAHEEDAIGEAVFASLSKLLVPVLVTREGVAAAVRAVCEQVRERETLVVRLAPADHALLAADPVPLGALASRVRLEPDPGVALAGCVVESSTGSLDGRLEVQLAKLRDALLRARAAAAEGAP